MRRRVVLFDLDGTLIDSGPIIMDAARYAVRAVLGRESDAELDELVRANIGGPGLTAMIESIDPGRVSELVDAYLEENIRLHADLDAFDAMLALLPVLRDGGRTLGIVTAKRRTSVELAFERFPVLRETTDVLIGAEDTERHKPHADPVLEGLRRLDAEPGEAAYIGDSPFDIRAGLAAGVLSIGVGWGGIHGDDALLAEGPDALVHEPEELLELV